MVDEQMRERVARAIHAQLTDDEWIDGPLGAREREHWYACADRAIAAMDDDWLVDQPCDCPGCQPVPAEPEIVTVRPADGVL